MDQAQILIRHAETREAVERCHPVMAQLRPHLSLADFTGQALRQSRQGYRLACAEIEGEVAAVAGYRLMENLAWGRFLYVDDLVTDEAWRSHGVGAALFEFLVKTARENECAGMHLDSGVQRFGAHRFYLAKRMDITSHHFAMKLAEQPSRTP